MVSAFYGRVSEYFVLEGGSAFGLVRTRRRLVDLYFAAGRDPKPGDEIGVRDLVGACHGARYLIKNCVNSEIEVPCGSAKVLRWGRRLRTERMLSSRRAETHRKTLLPGEQPAGEQRVQVSSAVGDQVDQDGVASDPVDHPEGLEEDLAVFADAKRQKFPGKGAPLRGCGQAFRHLDQPVEHMIRSRR